MHEMNPKNIDPRALTRAAELIGSRGSTPMMGPGPGGPQGPYNRYREMTLEELLLENRVIFLVGEINHVSAARVYMQMLYLVNIDARKDINLYINSPRRVGHRHAGRLRRDEVLSCDVATYCIGEWPPAARCC